MALSWLYAYYRRTLPRLLDALEFRCENTAYRPFMDALGLLARYANHPAREQAHPAAERVPSRTAARRR